MAEKDLETRKVEALEKIAKELETFNEETFYSKYPGITINKGF
ncbi:hypothetical protein [Methanobrevibacter arboriphilus]|nr:hypothetical protein [Methanobrevibacter arboriphilus]